MLGDGIFSIFGAGLNAAINSGLSDEQWGNQLRLMDIQNRYNEQMEKYRDWETKTCGIIQTTKIKNNLS